MKIFSLITLNEFKQDISDSLKQSQLVDMFSFIKIDEHSDQQNPSSNMTKKDLVVGYIEKVKLEVLVPSEKLSDLANVLLKIPGLENNSYSWTADINNLRLYKKLKEIENEN